MTVVMTGNALANPTRRWGRDKDNEGHDGQDTMMYEEVCETFCDFGLWREASILEFRHLDLRPYEGRWKGARLGNQH
jgi:hypothetical protein